MQEENFVKRLDTAELVDFNTKKYLYEVQKKLDIYDIQISVYSDQMENIFNDVVEVSLEEQEPGEDRTKGIIIKSDGSGKFYSIKNIRFDIVDFIVEIFSLVDGIEKRESLWFAVGIFLLKLMKKLGIELRKRQTDIIIVLYLETKNCIVTDENLEKIIVKGFERLGYRQIDAEEIYEDIRKLVKLGIIDIAEGKYIVAEKIYFK